MSDESREMIRCEHTVDGLLASVDLLKAEIHRLEDRNAALSEEVARQRAAAIPVPSWPPRRQTGDRA